MSARAFLPRHYTRDKDGAPSDTVPALTSDSDRGDGMAAVYGGPVGFQSTLGSLSADGVQADGASVPVMAATPPAVSYDPPAEGGIVEGASVPYDPRPDGPRYAAMGDAVTVNVAEWIGLRLKLAVELEASA